ncbi:MAG TPA: CAP domain-containing protein [Gaiellaceae bacterium]|nr:CAP domain-containing protein [Gaiellaceae bacterium]
MTSVSAAAPVRLLAPALAVAALLAFVVAGRAEGAGRSWSAYLAPAGACEAADDASAPTSAQVRAVACMLNWARVQDGRTRLVRRAALQQAAVLKGERVASCRQFSHTPCGSSVRAGVNASGYRYATFGENLFAGTWSRVSAREVVSAWLQSPPHRANVLSRQFRHVGVAPVRAPGLFDGKDAVVWTATFASPR